MKLLVLFIAVITLVGCKNPGTKIKSSEFDLECAIVHRSTSVYVSRCENKEVICYVSADGGIQCEFKEVSK